MGTPLSAKAPKLLPETPTVEPEELPRIITQERYEAHIAGAESEMDARLAANACPGQHLNSFRNLGWLGAGSFGEVYLVEFREDQTHYALKIQMKTQFTEPCARAAVLREKKLMYAMQSDFIVKAFFAFQDSANLYLVMEFAVYGDFSRFKGKCLQESLVKIYAAQLVLAIEYIHACNVIHRDLKPANVLIFGDACLKLTDFGVSKKVEGRTSSFIGPPAHMAPEIIRRQEYGREVDWWGVGLFIFELVFGEHPFCLPHWRRQQMMDAIMHVEVSFLARVHSSPSLRALLLGLLQKDRSKRLGGLNGRINDIKRHEWFEDISFIEVFNKRVPMTIKLDPVLPEQVDSDEFQSIYTETDDFGNQFEEF